MFSVYSQAHQVLFTLLPRDLQIQDTGCTVVSLQETKLDLVEVVEETLGSDFVRNFALLPAQGTQGGSFTVHENFCRLSDAEFRTNLSVSVQG